MDEISVTTLRYLGGGLSCRVTYYDFVIPTDYYLYGLDYGDKPINKRIFVSDSPQSFGDAPKYVQLDKQHNDGHASDYMELLEFCNRWLKEAMVGKAQETPYKALMESEMER